MSVSVQALVALDDVVDRGLLDELLSAEPTTTVLDYLEIGGPTASGYGAGDVLIVAAGDYTSEVKEYISEATRQHPARPVVLLTPIGANGYLRDAFGSGVDDIVAIPSEHAGAVDPSLARQLSFTLEKAVLRKAGADPARPVTGSRIVAVLGPKGGCGKTLVAVNLGAALAKQGHRVAMVDIDLQFGDLALAMGLRPDRTIYDLVRSGGSLDAEKLSDFMVEHPCGARVLLAPLRPDQASFVQVPFLREVLRLLRESHDFVIADTPPNFSSEVIAAIDISSDVLLVATRDTLSLKNTKLGLETLERMGYERRAIRTVLNRANTKVGIEGQDVAAILGTNPDVLVPSHRDITRSINQGTPIVLQAGSPVTRAFRELTQLYRQDRQGTSRETARHSEAAVAAVTASVAPTDGVKAGRGSTRRPLLLGRKRG